MEEAGRRLRPFHIPRRRHYPPLRFVLCALRPALMKHHPPLTYRPQTSDLAGMMHCMETAVTADRPMNL